MIKFKHEGSDVWFDETTAKVVAYYDRDSGIRETLYKTRLGKYVLDAPFLGPGVPCYTLLRDIDAAWWLHSHRKKMPWTLEGLISESEV